MGCTTSTRRLRDAAEHGREEEVRKLLQKEGVVVDGAKCPTPFALACLKQHVGIMRMLLAAGADPRQRFPLTYNEKLFWLKDKKTNGALVACHAANVEMLELMFRNGISAQDVFEEGALLVEAASSPKSTEMVTLLLDRGANVNLAGPDGRTALHEASECGRLDTARLLLDRGASVDATDVKGRTALHTAMGSYARMARLLLEAGASPNIKDVDGWSPFLLLFRGNSFIDVDDVDLIELLISRGANVQARSPDGSTVLSMAARFGNVEVIRLFLQHGASPDPNGRDLLEACSWGHHEVTEALLDAGAAVDVRCSRDDGETPLIKAVKHCQSDSVEMKDALLNMELLADQGADVDLGDDDGYTALHFALHAPLEMTRSLLQMGADPDATADDGVSPFLDAVEWNGIATVDMMLEHKLDSLPSYE